MALRPTPKRKVDYDKLDDLQKEIFGQQSEEKHSLPSEKSEDENFVEGELSTQKSTEKNISRANTKRKQREISTADTKAAEEEKQQEETTPLEESSEDEVPINALGSHLSDMETIANRIVSIKAGQGRNTTRPFSLPRTLIIDTTRLKAKFRTIDEQFTQNVIIDFLLREALAAVTPENYRDLKTAAFEFVKRPEETTRRSLTITEEVVYQMSELKAGINLETGKKYSNDEIFSTLLALGVSWLYRTGVLS